MRLLALIFMLFVDVAAVGAFCFDAAGQKYDIAPELLRSVAEVESAMNPDAVNRNSNGSIDFGLMQINSGWISTIGMDTWMTLGDPCTNVMVGARILRDCIDRHGLKWKAVGCYNAKSEHKRVRYAHKVNNALKRLRWSDGPDQPIVNPWAKEKVYIAGGFTGAGDYEGSGLQR